VGGETAYTPYAMLYDPTGGGANKELGGLSIVENYWYYSAARSINNASQIVGSAYVVEEGITTNNHACIFDPTGGGNNIDLGRGWACSNNNSGQIVGRDYNGHAYSFDPTGGGNNIDLGSGSAYSINDNGQIVGGDNNGHACIFDPTGGGNNIDLGSGCAYSINDKGQIVGVGYNGHACIFDPTGHGANIDLGTLSGYDYSEATSINDSGQIIGYAESATSNTCACLFDPTGQGNNLDLNTLIDPACGLRLMMAQDINNNGCIVGISESINASNGVYAFQLVPIPEPSVLALFGAGGISLLAYSLRRRKLKE
jgi:probable HAF family extracellular repeat protein